MDQLKQIGFYTLEDRRAERCSKSSPLWRCELLLTSRCNFNCPYCRGTTPHRDATWREACDTVVRWASEGLRNVRFSGGEPTLWPHLVNLVRLANTSGIKRIAISTNGSADRKLYDNLIRAGVNDFSISLDGCCADTIDKMAGGKKVSDVVTENIRYLSGRVYTTVGVVLTDDNLDEAVKTIEFAQSLGVWDIRIIPAAQNSTTLPNLNTLLDPHGKEYPILRYRVWHARAGMPVRGIVESDNHQCPLALDDMAVWNGEHYPCIIHLREGGKPIGKVGPNMREERAEWVRTHDCFKDPVCQKNCLDVCVAYNNRVRELQGETV